MSFLAYASIIVGSESACSKKLKEKNIAKDWPPTPHYELATKNTAGIFELVHTRRNFLENTVATL